MFAYIKGTLARITADSVIVDVNGVGYKIFTAGSALAVCNEIGSEIRLHTCFYVREDTHALYGFLNEDELKMFEQLITVTGVGPKAALSLISNIPPSKFGLAVLTDDVESFTKAPGIGKKTAQRIILELKDKLKKLNDQFGDIKTETSGLTSSSNKLQEAVSALIMLGYSSQEANAAVLTVYDEEKTIEQIIKDALKNSV
ncbi:MAG: Holliday junction branch migration protein RuvA [Clostridiaceae bacterium]|nr:Holliday junction branch migration protein RuvA [Clostridiaceae bacterium]